MSRHSLKYGGGEFKVNLPDELIKEVVEPNHVELLPGTPEEHVRRSLESPVGTPPFDEIFHAGEKVCIAISDITRQWQSPAVVVPLLVERLNRLGIPDADITVLSGTGTHRRQTSAEHDALITAELCGRVRIIDHSCTESECTYLGTTSRGTPVKINSIAAGSDRLILVGGVVYHFLAGFGGGVKNILPGISARETIMKNHALALNEGLGSGTNPDVRSGNISASNPFHMDQVEAARMVKPDFIVNVVVDGDYKVIKAFAGDVIEAHRAAAKLVSDIDAVPIERKYPLCIATAGGFPKDINLYQTSKTLCNVLAAAERGGTIIVMSRCGEGFGDPDCESQIRDYDSLYDREVALRDNFSIGAYIGYLFCEAAEKFNFIMVTDIPRESFAKMKITAAATLDEALEAAKRLNGGTLEMPVCLMPHGAETLPHIRGEE
ncbi:nickel-dependent lactate racemase [Cloacibacillus sp.]|uniref:nickel-dependent lactate racemase n=1 Tax=Cloacibacillus sp. TaxID=2049023 RepID=UPI0025C58449|nr:nickel-dependent lactate racemase [Cloacibacillus sp.]MCC8056990.1 nickel-dependent lactate racemase [Cloacibacillus sp.]